MDKNKTRPLLVGIVERWRALEQQAYRTLQEHPQGSLAAERQQQVEWSTAHRELTQAETLLWLADQQWGREERLASNLSPLASVAPTAPETAPETKPDPTAKPL